MPPGPSDLLTFNLPISSEMPLLNIKLTLLSYQEGQFGNGMYSTWALLPWRPDAKNSFNFKPPFIPCPILWANSFFVSLASYMLLSVILGLLYHLSTFVLPEFVFLLLFLIRARLPFTERSFFVLEASLTLLLSWHPPGPIPPLLYTCQVGLLLF